MVEHIVLLKFKADTSAAQKESALAALRGMDGKIPGVLGVSAGMNFTDRGKGFEAGLVVRVESKDALPAYLEHPVHTGVVSEHLKPILEDVLALDYEI